MHRGRNYIYDADAWFVKTNILIEIKKEHVNQYESIDEGTHIENTK